MGGGIQTGIGVWVSGFYGSGKSSLTKYLGFALDPDRQIDGKPFLSWLQNQFTSKQLRDRLAMVAQKHPASVIMLDLASEQLAGATMAEISSVL
jgi:energy-coupling factor transporter ATP-binding protein EcfA2